MPSRKRPAELDIETVRGGTYLVMEGPQFSTLAESNLYRSWGCDVIGMTNLPEAKLAREAEMCYATVAMVTDYDCWHPDHDNVTVEAIIRVLMDNADKGRALVKRLTPKLAGTARSRAARAATRRWARPSSPRRKPGIQSSSPCWTPLPAGSCLDRRIRQRGYGTVKVGDRHYRSIWISDDGRAVDIIDQTRLPHEFVVARLETLEEAAEAIETMRVRGAPLIGATAAYGLALAAREDATDAALDAAYRTLLATRPTAVNLRWALDDVMAVIRQLPPERRAEAACRRAAEICDEDVAINDAIGEHGLELIREAWLAKGQSGRVNVLTHCNAGWLATVDWGTALAPIYKAFDAGIPVHVWVDETRPRNQGASLTAWELGQHGVPHTVIVDNAGGHLMQHGMVDLCIVGTDRTTASGDVCNKIGTYLKALAAQDNGIPFYVALPSPTIDWTLRDGVREIPIEERDATEVTRITGRAEDGRIVSVGLTPAASPAANFAFDVTPARLVTALITERGVCAASEAGLKALYPERAWSVSNIWFVFPTPSASDALDDGHARAAFRVPGRARRGQHHAAMALPAGRSSRLSWRCRWPAPANHPPLPTAGIRAFPGANHRPAINARHVFCGEVRDGKPKGFHSTRLMDTSDEVTGVRGISRYANGIYSGTVVFKDGQTKFSTFFPDACSADDILASIHHASTHIGGEHPAWGYLGPSAPAGGTDGFCLDDRGQAFEIRMGLFGDGRVNTAFPNR